MSKMPTVEGELVRTTMLDYITDYYMKYGVPPSLEEILDGMSDTIKSKSTIKHHMEIMIKRGDIVVAGELRGRSRVYVPAGYKVVKV